MIFILELLMIKHSTSTLIITWGSPKVADPSQGSMIKQGYSEQYTAYNFEILWFIIT